MNVPPYGPKHRLHRFARLVAAASIAGTLLAPAGLINSALAAALPTTVLNDPPRAGHEVTAFPSRDFVSVTGYAQDETVTIEVHHATRGGAIVSSQSGLVPQDDPATPEFDGIVEVNHPGGGCWVGVTPNIVPGDLIRVVVDSASDPARVGVADQTTVADVTAGRPTNPAPGTIIVKGTAKAADGSPLPLDQIEQRLVAAGDLFSLGGKRTLRAPGTRGATLAYDAPGSTEWTATYTGLSASDVEKALGAESRIMWLGRDPLAGRELTIFESGAGVVGGPSAPCTAPKEKLPPLPGQDTIAPSVPQNVQAVVTDNNVVTLTWNAADDNDPAGGVTNYGIFRNGIPIWTVQNADGSAPAPTTYVERNVPPGDYTYTVDAADAVDNRSNESAPATATATPNPATTPDLSINEPPVGREIIAFPSRDFAEAAGYPLDQTLTMQVIRNGRIVSDATGLIPSAEGGTVEVNHPGGACWDGTTPELRTGDIVRVLAYGPDGVLVSVDQTTVANVTAQKAVKVTDDDPATPAGEGKVEVHGTAAGHDGLPLPIGNIEQRLISSSAERFLLNDRRALLAPGDGTLAYDKTNNPDGTKWTATYTGLLAADVQKALDVESRILWLGKEPLVGAELTIFEVGLADPPGPSTGFCTSPLEPLDTADPSTPGLTATARGDLKEVDLAWTASTDNVYVYGYRIYRDTVLLRVVKGNVTAFTDTNVGPGAHSYAVEAFDSASARGAGATDVEKIAAGLGLPYGNTSARSAAASITMLDVTAPTVPANLQVTNPTNVDPVTGAVTGTRNARVVFDPSTDDSGAAPLYEIYRDGVLLPTATPTLNTLGKMVYIDQRLTNGQTYRYAVLAKDGAGNKSAKTSEVSVTIAADADAPTFTGTPTATVPDIHGKDVVISWQAATDNIGVTGYGIYRDGTRIAQLDGTTLTFRDTNLAAGTYNYKVDAVDSANNRSNHTTQPAQTAVIANEPPVGGHAIIAFPSRDFVEASGYSLEEGPVQLSVIRNGVAISTSGARTPVDDPNTAGFDGIIEINHAGAGCWTTNTPDIRLGDVVRATNKFGVADQITVQGVTAQRPYQTVAGTVVVKGTAVSAEGKRLPLGEIEQRLIATDANFAKNGRNKLLAPGDGTIAYDNATGPNWTATYTGLSATDVTRALGAESRILSLGREPLIGNELTIFENGPGVTGGPATPDCAAPLEPSAPLVSWTPNSMAFGNQSAVPASTSAAKTVTFTNAGSSPVDVTAVYLAGANPGDYTITAGDVAQTLAPGASKTVSVTFSPKAVGARSATLNFMSNGANTAYQTINLTGNGVGAAAPSTPGRPTIVFGTDPLGTSTAPVKVSWTASTGTLTHYQLQRATGTGVFADTTPQPSTATTITQQVAAGSYRYQVRACNGTNCSAWTTATSITLGAVQESSANLQYGGTWSGNVAVSGAFGGNVRNSSTAQANVRYNFTASTIQFISTKGPNRGNVQIIIGGQTTTVNLYAATEQPRQVVFSRTGLPTNSQTTIEVRVPGTRTAPSTANRVDVDAFVTLR